jgi:hypothetical protein
MRLLRELGKNSLKVTGMEGFQPKEIIKQA